LGQSVFLLDSGVHSSRLVRPGSDGLTPLRIFGTPHLFCGDGDDLANRSSWVGRARQVAAPEDPLDLAVG